MVLDWRKGSSFIYKEVRCPVLALGIIKVKLLLFKVFKSMGNQGKRPLYVRIFFANSIPVILYWHESYIAWIGVTVCKTSADTQKAVLGKNDHNGYECKSERSFANLTVLSVRFLFLKVQSSLFFDGRCALCFGKTRHIVSRKSGSVFLPNVFAFSFHQDRKK